MGYMEKEMNKFKHIVIVGYPRSGTTLLYCMLRSCITGYKCYHKEVFAHAAHGRDQFLPKITKHPADLLNLHKIIKDIPNVGFILCMRDPRAVLTSYISADPGFRLNWDTCFHTKEPNSAGLVELNHRAVSLLELHPPFLCRYEDLVTSPDAIQESMAKKFNFKFTGKFSDFHTVEVPEYLEHRLNGVRPVSVTHINTWRNHPSRIYTQFMQCPELFDIVKFWKYEEDNSWFNEVVNEAFRI